jgi:hypothetical protein
MKEYTIVRYDLRDDVTLGLFLIDGEYFCDTLERPWKDNTQNISCIPEGGYEISVYVSPKRKEKCILVHDVKDRFGIEIHEANMVTELEGCIAVGIKSMDVVLRSREHLNHIIKDLGFNSGRLIVERI